MRVETGTMLSFLTRNVRSRPGHLSTSAAGDKIIPPSYLLCLDQICCKYTLKLDTKHPPVQFATLRVLITGRFFSGDGGTRVV